MPVSNDFKQTFNSIVTTVGEALKDVSTLTVRTWYVTIGDDEAASGAAAAAEFEARKKPLAKTVIKVDGDCESILPMRKGADGKLEVDKDLLGLHDGNVETARKYRSDIMNTFLGLISQGS